MLSDEEQRRLEAIERELETADPKLAKRLARPYQRAMAWVLLALIACAAVLTAVVVKGWWALAILAIFPALMFAAGTLARYRATAKDLDKPS
ncbi:DUF3040 domain-containing protein [Catelliglobosispora koreensis]|uniref:DUF3040 domain-containing protein n=1 Tax=Catelliglobosispora koreensis TaxID=129052 RepID=UPI00036F4612|nr:DUF3040 domain-containing protein [Catelliglobosispora koreensis]